MLECVTVGPRRKIMKVYEIRPAICCLIVRRTPTLPQVRPYTQFEHSMGVAISSIRNYW